MIIFVTVKTGGRESRVHKVDDSHFSVRVKERPVDGKANGGVIRALAHYFSCPQSSITILSGGSSKMKRISVDL